MRLRAVLRLLVVCTFLSAPAWAENDGAGSAEKLPAPQVFTMPERFDPVLPDGLDDARLAVGEVPGIEALFAACPADLWRTRVTLRALLATPVASEAACAADRTACLDACITTGDGSACLYLGLALETNGWEEDALIGRRYHALACANGEPAGCTNRGGGIRNVPLPGDPLSNAPEAERFACLFPTFRASCGADDAWGCTMGGQTHANGEGTPVNEVLARRLYDRACTLSQDEAFAACEYARYLTDMLAIPDLPDD